MENENNYECPLGKFGKNENHLDHCLDCDFGKSGNFFNLKETCQYPPGMNEMEYVFLKAAYRDLKGLKTKEGFWELIRELNNKNVKRL
jgi:hypothetical protein